MDGKGCLAILALAALTTRAMAAAANTCPPQGKAVVLVKAYDEETCAEDAMRWNKYTMNTGCYAWDLSANQFFKVELEFDTGDVVITSYHDETGKCLANTKVHAVTRTGYVAPASEDGKDCRKEPALHSAVAWPQSEGGWFQYEVICGTELKSMQATSGISNHAKLDCSDTDIGWVASSSDGVDGSDLPSVVVSSTEGVCQMTSSVTSSKYTCLKTDSGEDKLIVDLYPASADCTGGEEKKYEFTPASSCHSGEADYQSLDQNAPGGVNVKRADPARLCSTLAMPIECWDNVEWLRGGEATQEKLDEIGRGECSVLGNSGSKKMRCSPGVTSCIRVVHDEIPCVMTCAENGIPIPGSPAMEKWKVPQNDKQKEEGICFNMNGEDATALVGRMHPSYPYSTDSMYYNAIQVCVCEGDSCNPASAIWTSLAIALAFLAAMLF